MTRVFFFFLFLLLIPGFLHAQAVSINTDGSNPAPSAILDVKSTDKGMLSGQKCAKSERFEKIEL
jgi:hypothetical protein